MIFQIVKRASQVLEYSLTCSYLHDSFVELDITQTNTTMPTASILVVNRNTSRKGRHMIVMTDKTVGWGLWNVGFAHT